MIALSLPEVAAAIGGQVRAGVDADAVTLTEVSIDSRRTTPGALFVALAGEHGDGHDYVAAASAAGAAAALVSRPQPVGIPQVVVPDVSEALLALGAHVRRQVPARAVAVTGSVGKTTVKDLTAAALRTELRTVAARGSFNNELGVPLTLLALEPDTQALVAEIGARHVGDIAHLAPAVAPDISMVTAVAGVHLEIFGSIERIAEAKAELVEALGPDGTAVLHVADPRVAAMAARAPASLGVALDDPRADVTAERIELDRFARPRGVVRTPWGTASVGVPLSGRHHLLNALFALAAAGLCGIDPVTAADAIGRAEVSPWRGEILERDGLTVLNDAYNASPTSVSAALRTLVAVARRGRSLAVLGVMAEIGPTSAAEHEKVGALAVELGVDHLVVVGADAVGIAEGARRAGADPSSVTVVATRQEAAEVLGPLLATDDVVLVKGSRVAGLDALARDLVAPPTDAAGAEREPTT